MMPRPVGLTSRSGPLSRSATIPAPLALSMLCIQQRTGRDDLAWATLSSMQNQV